VSARSFFSLLDLAGVNVLPTPPVSPGHADSWVKSG
jgi:hypothetical protein